MRSGETAAIVARELAEQTKGELRPGDVPSTVKAMAQLVELLDVQLRNLTPGGKDTAARSLNKVSNLLINHTHSVQVLITQLLHVYYMLITFLHFGFEKALHIHAYFCVKGSRRENSVLILCRVQCFRQ